MNFGSLYRLLNLISYYLLLNKLCETDNWALFHFFRPLCLTERQVRLGDEADRVLA